MAADLLIFLCAVSLLVSEASGCHGSHCGQIKRPAPTCQLPPTSLEQLHPTGTSYAPGPPTQLFIDPVHGSDSNSGLTPIDAFRSIHRAQLAVRNATASLLEWPPGGIAVNLLPGYYSLLQSPVTFSALDSGAPTSPIIYRGIAHPPPEVIKSNASITVICWYLKSLRRGKL